MTALRALRAPGGKAAVAPVSYGLRIPADIERRMRRYRASVRAAIQKHLGEIAADAAAPRPRTKSPDQKEPPLRFYVYEGYRIAYQLDAAARRVVVLDLAVVPGD